jgi:hypothetical protein
MATLTFVYRSDPNPRLLQSRRDGFLFSGSVRVDDGFVTVNGVLTTYALLRPLTFYNPDDPDHVGAINPGDLGIKAFGFNNGSLGLRSATSTALILGSSPSVQFYGGRIQITAISNGSLTGFSVWGLTQEDPKDFYVQTATDLSSGNVGSPWTRMSAVFVPHRNSRYIGVGAKVYAVPNSGAYRTQYFDKWMLEKAAVGDAVPSPSYSPAREVQVTIRPTHHLTDTEIADQTPVVQRILEDNVPMGIGVADPVWDNPA